MKATTERLPFQRRKFVAYTLFFALCFVLFVIPYLWVDKHTAMLLMMGYLATMFVFEQVTTPKIELPSEALPPKVRAEAIETRRRRRQEAILGSVFIPAMVFIFLAPQKDEMYATHGWTSAVALITFVVLSLWMLAEKTRYR